MWVPSRPETSIWGSFDSRKTSESCTNKRALVCVSPWPTMSVDSYADTIPRYESSRNSKLAWLYPCSPNITMACPRPLTSLPSTKCPPSTVTRAWVRFTSPWSAPATATINKAAAAPAPKSLSSSQPSNARTSTTTGLSSNPSIFKLPRENSPGNETGRLEPTATNRPGKGPPTT